jgi:coenzyme F420-0:L-glutamate ligase/coenzyme F420-1:gamma-L-glutamate ligase
MPEAVPGAPLGQWIADAVAIEQENLVVAQKIVSKAEGRIVKLADVTPSEFARQIAEGATRLVEIVLRETRRIVRMDPESSSPRPRGFVCANAGVDLSTSTEEPARHSCRSIPMPQAVAGEIGVAVGVIISDTFGRPWREGLVDVAIGMHGFAATTDCRGQADSYGYPLQATISPTPTNSRPPPD